MTLKKIDFADFFRHELAPRSAASAEVKTISGYKKLRFSRKFPLSSRESDFYVRNISYRVLYRNLIGICRLREPFSIEDLCGAASSLNDESEETDPASLLSSFP